MNSVKVIHPGFFTTVQDLGRYGYAKFGVPISGAMDSISAQRANLLLNNDKNDAVLEIIMQGPILEFTGKTTIAITGAHFLFYLNDLELKMNKTYTVATGDKLTFKKLVKGLCAYLAIAGGFQTELVLGSRSMYKGITKASKLSKGDLLPVYEGNTNTIDYARVNFRESEIFNTAIDVCPGPEFELLSHNHKQNLLQTALTVISSSNRMAFQFENLIDNNFKGLVTAPVLPGTVQLTPLGNVIVLMRDCQVTGGYPRILQLTEMGICALSQKPAGSKVVFDIKID